MSIDFSESIKSIDGIDYNVKEDYNKIHRISHPVYDESSCNFTRNYISYFANIFNLFSPKVTTPAVMIKDITVADIILWLDVTRDLYYFLYSDSNKEHNNIVASINRIIMGMGKCSQDFPDITFNIVMEYEDEYLVLVNNYKEILYLLSKPTVYHPTLIENFTSLDVYNRFQFTLDEADLNRRRYTYDMILYENILILINAASRITHSNIFNNFSYNDLLYLFGCIVGEIQYGYGIMPPVPFRKDINILSYYCSMQTKENKETISKAWDTYSSGGTLKYSPITCSDKQQLFLKDNDSIITLQE